VYRVKEETKVYIDVGDVAELKSLTTEPNLVLGANMSLTEAMDTFNRISKDNTHYKYTKVLADHIDLIANVPVRNVSTSFCYAAQLLNGAVCLRVTTYGVETFPKILEECFSEPSVHVAQTAWRLMPENVNIQDPLKMYTHFHRFLSLKCILFFGRPCTYPLLWRANIAQSGKVKVKVAFRGLFGTEAFVQAYCTLAPRNFRLLPLEVLCISQTHSALC
jgi:hypothetical protein